MLKLIIYNLFSFIIFLFFGLWILHFIYIGPIQSRAYEILSIIKQNPYYDPIIENIGIIPENENPTSYLNVNYDSSKIIIGVFGDSHTAGDEALPGDDFPTVLQKLLGEKYQVLNFGQSGFNFNQIYLAIKYFSLFFNFDYIIIGPRGLYKDRFSSFNKFWNQGNIPNARFIIENDQLIQLDPPGSNIKSKISNLYSFIPHPRYITHDNAAIGPLKLFEKLRDKKIYNPFFQEYDHKKVISELLKSLAKDSNFPIIHFTDQKKDCDWLSKIRTKNYFFYCYKNSLHRFPNQARISHPSAFGYYRHAQEIKALITENKVKFAPLKFFDLKDDFYSTTIAEAKGKSINLKNFKITYNNNTLATFNGSIGYKDKSGRLQERGQLLTNKNYIAIGFYRKNHTKASSLFITIPRNDLNHELLTGVSFEALKTINNIFFLEIPSDKINLEKNYIRLDHEWTQYPLFKKIFTMKKTKKYNYYSPGMNSYRMAVNIELSAFDFFQKYKQEMLYLEYGTN